MDGTLKQNYQGVFDGTLGMGEAPALLVVDFVNAYTTPGELLFAPAVVQAVQETVSLLEVARRAAIPVIFTKVAYSASGLDGGVFVRKVPLLRTFVQGNPMIEIVEALRPLPDEVVLTKKYASAFFGTPLASLLTSLRVDTVILVGCSTSGCIRATAVDGMQHGFRVLVPRECVGDRHAAPHEANLFDIHSKYGDVVSKQEVIELLPAKARGRGHAGTRGPLQESTGIGSVPSVLG